MKRMKKLLAFALVLLIGGGIFLSAFPFRASATTANYSSVLEDLNRDPDFDVTLYPHNASDYSLKFLTMAEGAGGEVFIYVYQPAAPTKFLPATSIVFSTGIGADDRSYVDYDLSLISMDGVFQKYRVQDFAVKDAATRYYAFSQIYRAYDGSIDPPPSTDNTIDYKAFPIGQLWTAIDSNEGVNYSIQYEDVIDVTEKHVGFVRYNGGFFFFQEDVDSHYVAFSVDHEIDQLLEVDICYRTRKTTIVPSKSGITTETTSVTSDRLYDTLSAAEVFEVNTSGFFSKTYKYNRIQKVSDFIANEGSNADASDLDYLQDKEWVLRFYESPYVDTLQGSSSGDGLLTTYTGKYEATRVFEIAFFRMAFIYDGVYYNLGVVDDKQTGSNQPDITVPQNYDDEWEKLLFWIALIAVVVFIIFFFGPVLTMCKMIFSCLAALLQVVWWCVSLPFRVLKRLLSSQ
ncbi:MAG: hypothetical protein J6J66_02175 [Clostridia bacterium]|nr:hypothetical protein [Clostridia bacterium]